MTRIKDIMARQVHSTTLTSSLADACRVMWEYDVGAVPVIDAKTNTLHGIVTDRDACMASYLRGLSLVEVPVFDAMAQAPCTCKPDDELKAVHTLMRQHQVRRLPVVDQAGALLGMISLNDLVLAAEKAAAKDQKVQVADTLASICKHRPRPRSEELVSAAEEREIASPL